MRILVAPDKFKSSLSAGEAARIIANGILEVAPHIEVDVQPLADGGEGTISVITEALGGEIVDCAAHDAMGRPVPAAFGWVEETKLAVIEISQASGLWRIAANERDPWRASTFGTGEVIRAALSYGAERVMVGLGGSATNDAGAGMAAALGFKFLDRDGATVDPMPGNFSKIHRVIRPSDFPSVPFDVLCDVTNPLSGPLGATRVFGPQKGVVPAEVDHMDAVVSGFAAVVERDLGVRANAVAGAGAAGGAGFGFMAFCGGQVRSGFDVISELTGIERRVAACDLVITAEGGVDFQTLHGKGPGALARLARRHHKRVVVIAGRIEDQVLLEEVFHRLVPLSEELISVEESVARAAELLGIATRRVAMLEVEKI
jgi:glycerate kinase